MQMVWVSGALHWPLVELRVSCLGNTLLPNPNVVQLTGMCTVTAR